ncbi:MAG: ATP-binding cassette domain-containing protein [Iphinoe sp. HA4291-MV1]|jgi:ABC-type polysaccharide/polyol phosphate transport system ATPase subunit|nr:ATP-binding cassette domain-containing protein [Iphinoe sp. HA4291-MV1]
MSDTVIRVENLSKKYVLSHQQTGGSSRYNSLRDAIAQGAKSLGKRLLKPSGQKTFNPKREEFWALKDVSFEVKQGDRLGFLGHNGAGKSTLLKILSRIVEPTQGKISIKGRVASLLEVGTGFHPELTGRENIFLNGAILGMGREEIKRKFDEIVDFAEVEKFLDTPVKKYSSGMYVRLAFAVAAHLEPEILIVDEVLAVGDAQFQKKCLGKMQEVSTDQGRTVLFVSHNMDAIQRLCSHCVMLERGRLIAQGRTDSIVVRYMSNNSTIQASPNQWIDVSQVSRTGTGEAHFVAVQYSSLNEAAAFQPYSNGTLEFLLAIESDSVRQIGSIAITIYNQLGTKLVNADSLVLGQSITLEKGKNIVKFRIGKLYLTPGIYVLGLWMADPLTGIVFNCIESAFEIEVINFKSEGLGIRPDADGLVICDFEIMQMTELIR